MCRLRVYRMLNNEPEKNATLRRSLYSVLGLVLIVLLFWASYANSKFAPKSKDFWEYIATTSIDKWLNNWPKWLDMPLQPWANSGLDWLVINYGIYFDMVNDFILSLVISIKDILTYVPWPLVILGVCLLTWFVSGKKRGTTLLVTLCMFFIGFLSPKFWDKALESTSIMLIAIFICLLVGIPTAIWMSRSARVRNAILPVLDLMQTIPSFCYLIPGIMLFGLGAVPAIIATVIYAMPPLIRLTDLGIRLVDEEIIEAADSFGASSKQKLWAIQIPLAMPNIMQGINQCTMMALAMVVIASMIGTRGLGDEVLLGLQQLNVGRALEAGIAIVLLAIVLDRITQAYGDRIQERTH
mgnify:CR=1 FL=1